MLDNARYPVSFSPNRVRQLCSTASVFHHPSWGTDALGMWHDHLDWMVQRPKPDARGAVSDLAQVRDALRFALRFERFAIARTLVPIPELARRCLAAWLKRRLQKHDITLVPLNLHGHTILAEFRKVAANTPDESFTLRLYNARVNALYCALTRLPEPGPQAPLLTMFQFDGIKWGKGDTCLNDAELLALVDFQSAWSNLPGCILGGGTQPLYRWAARKGRFKRDPHPPLHPPQPPRTSNCTSMAISAYLRHTLGDEGFAGVRAEMLQQAARAYGSGAWARVTPKLARSLRDAAADAQLHCAPAAEVSTGSSTATSKPPSPRPPGR